MPTPLAPTRQKRSRRTTGCVSNRIPPGHRRGVVTVEARMTDMTSQAVDRPATSSDGGSRRVWACVYPNLTSGERPCRRQVRARARLDGHLYLRVLGPNLTLLGWGAMNGQRVGYTRVRTPTGSSTASRWTARSPTARLALAPPGGSWKRCSPSSATATTSWCTRGTAWLATLMTCALGADADRPGGAGAVHEGAADLHWRRTPRWRRCCCR